MHLEYISLQMLASLQMLLDRALGCRVRRLLLLSLKSVTFSFPPFLFDGERYDACLQVLCQHCFGLLIGCDVDHIPGEPDRVGCPVALHQTRQTLLLYDAGNSMEGIAIAVGCLHHPLHLYKPDTPREVVHQDADSPCLAAQPFSGACFVAQYMILLT